MSSDDADQTTALHQARWSDHTGTSSLLAYHPEFLECEQCCSDVSELGVASSYRGRDKPPPTGPAASSGEKWLRDALGALNAWRAAEAGVGGGALARNCDGGALDDGAGTQAQRDDWFVGNDFTKCKKKNWLRRKLKKSLEERIRQVRQEAAEAQAQSQGQVRLRGIVMVAHWTTAQALKPKEMTCLTGPLATTDLTNCKKSTMRRRKNRNRQKAMKRQEAAEAQVQAQGQAQASSDSPTTRTALQKHAERHDGLRR